MCFHSKQTKKATELEHRFKASIIDKENFLSSSTINGFSFPKTPIITNKDKEYIQNFNWGLIPPDSKDNAIKKYTLNARIETLEEKPSFRSVIQNRCLILADGFYEWQWLDKKGKEKQKYELTIPKNEAFAFAGLWSEWINESTNEVVKSYTIVTTEANQQMSEIHNSSKRMPVILPVDIEREWLDETVPYIDFANVTPELVAIPIDIKPKQSTLFS